MNVEQGKKIGLVEPFRLIPSRFELIFPRNFGYRAYWINSVFLELPNLGEESPVVQRVGVSAFYDTLGSAVSNSRTYLEFVGEDEKYDFKVTGLPEDAEKDSERFKVFDLRMVMDSVSLRGYQGSMNLGTAQRLRLAVFLDCDQSAQAVFSFEQGVSPGSDIILPREVTAKAGNEPMNLLKRARNGLILPEGRPGLLNDLWGVFYIEPRTVLACEGREAGIPSDIYRPHYRLSPQDRIQSLA